MRHISSSPKIAYYFLFAFTLCLFSLHHRQVMADGGKLGTIDNFSGFSKKNRDHIRRKITSGANFNQHYYIISFGCGTECKLPYLIDIRSEEVYSFGYGGEEHSQLHIEHSSNSPTVSISFKDNPIIDLAGKTQRKYEASDEPCAALRLIWANDSFQVVHRTEYPSYGRTCPKPDELFSTPEDSPSKFERECYPNLIKFNVCEQARSIAIELEKELPIEKDSLASVESVWSEGVMLTYLVRWGITRGETYSGLKANGISRRNFRGILSKQSITAMCSNEEASAFLRLGGKVKYQYLSSDGFHLESFIVERSDCESAD